MLKNIRLHIEKDPEKQDALEAKLATHFNEIKSRNLNAFQRNIPSLLPLLTNNISTNISIFVNKYGEYNFVDYGLGRTLYGFNPQQEIHQQVDLFYRHCTFIDLKSDEEKNCDDQEKLDHSANFEQSLARYQNNPAFPMSSDCLVVLGIGLGLHLSRIIKERHVKHIIVYEVEPQYFSASTHLIDWKEIFDLAKEREIALYLQVAKDGRDLIADIEQLIEHFGISGFFLYKHYNHPIYDSVEQQLTSTSWTYLQKNGFAFSMDKSSDNYFPTWLPPTDPVSMSALDSSHPKLQKNLNAFKKFLPDIYQQFKDYEPKNWLAVTMPSGQVNLAHKSNLLSWYSENPEYDCQENLKGFAEQPNKDGLVLNYTGEKLAHYIHYQFVEESLKLIADVEEERGSLPKNIESIILFGVGVGYQVNYLFQQHKIKNIFVCEPNRDFFYGSLFAVDWYEHLDTLEKTEGRIYLNIGDDGTNLMKDLLSQFQSIGSYILNNTYFYQSYYNARLNEAIAKLREQLQIVICMGEYFDHAFFGTKHTLDGLKNDIAMLKKEPGNQLSYATKECPVFIIGNGPSLDQSIEILQEHQEQAILVSCGTALQVLQRRGITPDFQSEIEQNRATHDWASLVRDTEFLKKVTLLSCNGIHPDTSRLYKNTMIAFKDGESSTAIALNVMRDPNFQLLENAFPTVANFSIELFTKLGFKEIYLIGIDLGFVDVNHHHSKLSGYYAKSGKQLFDYGKKNNTALRVEGNFRPVVNTKHEFKIAKQMLENVTLNNTKLSTYFNCSDGAKIRGCIPLELNNILITSTVTDKHNALDDISKNAFKAPPENIDELIENGYSSRVLKMELEHLDELLQEELETVKDAKKLIEQQKEALFHSYKRNASLLFYYLYGTVNFANASMTKILGGRSEDESVPEEFTKNRALWYKYFCRIKNMALSPHYELDTSFFDLISREMPINAERVAQCKFLVITNSIAFANSIIAQHEYFNWQISLDILPYCMLDDIAEQQYEYLIFDQLDDAEQKLLPPTNVKSLRGTRSTVVLKDWNDTDDINDLFTSTANITTVFRHTAPGEYYWRDDKTLMANMCFHVSVQEHTSQLIFPKYLCNTEHVEDLYSENPLARFDENSIIVDFYHYFTVSSIPQQKLELFSATRGKIMHHPIFSKELVGASLSLNEMKEISEAITTVNPELIRDKSLNHKITK